MSRMKNFEKRTIALNEDNQSILKLWGNSIQKCAPGAILFEYEKKHEEKQTGTGNRILSWYCETFECTYFDQGKKFELNSLSVELNPQAYEFIDDFRQALIALAMELKLTAEIDSDLSHRGDLATHPFSIIKEILLRTLASCFAKKADIDDSANNYLKVFENFNSELTKLPVAFNSKILAWITSKQYTAMIDKLGNIIPLWINTARAIIESVKDLNLVTNTIESNQEALDLLLLTIHRHVYCRLIIDVEKREIDSDYLQVNWIDVALKQYEEKLLHSECVLIEIQELPQFFQYKEISPLVQNRNAIILMDSQLFYLNQIKQDLIKIDQTDANKKSYTELTKKCASANKMANQSEFELIQKMVAPQLINGKLSLKENIQRTNALCQILKSKTEAHNFEPINNLYRALKDIRVIQEILNHLSTLSNDLGCLLFLFNKVNTLELSRQIFKCVTQATEACQDPVFVHKAGLSVYALQEQNNAGHFPLTKVHNFASLDESFRRKSEDRIYGQLLTLYNAVQETGNPGLIDFSSIFRLESNQFPQLSYPQTKESRPEKPHKAANKHQALSEVHPQNYISNVIHEATAEKSLPLILHIHEPNTSKYVADITPFNPNCFFDALGLERIDVLQMFFEKIKASKELQLVVSLEAFERFKNRKLPQELIAMLSDNEELLVNTTFITLQRRLNNFCETLRKELKNQLVIDCLSMNNSDLIDHISKTAPQLLTQKPLSIEYLAYKKEEETRLCNLKTICAGQAWIITYFEHYYLNRKKGFIYIPLKPNLLRSLLEIIDIPVRIWGSSNKNTEPVEIESFHINSHNTLLVRNILYFEGSNLDFTPFQAWSPPEKSNKSNKLILLNILHDLVLGNNGLSEEQQKSIIRYFHVDNPVIAESGISSKLKKIHELEKQMHSAWKNLDLNGSFYKAGLEYVLNRLQTELTETSRKKPQYILNENILRAHTDLAINTYFSEEIVNIYQKQTLSLDTPGILYWKGKTYQIFCKHGVAGQQATFSLYRHKQGLYYGDNQDSKTQALEEIFLQEDNQNGLLALGVSGKNNLSVFLKTLESAIKNDVNRNLLSQEIRDYLLEIHRGSITFQSSLMREDIRQGFQDKDVRDKEIQNIIALINNLSGQSLKTFANCLHYLLNNPNEYPRERKIIFNHIELNEIFNKQLNTYCSDYRVCQNYINIYKQNLKYPIGRYSAKLYAKEKGYNLEVYDKCLNTPVPVLSLDGSASYKTDKSSNILRIVYDNGFFNKMHLSQEDEDTPEVLWAQYIKDIECNIRKQLPVLTKDSVIHDYLAKIKQSLREPMLLENLRIIHHQRATALTTLLKQKGELEKIKCQRDKEEANFAPAITFYLNQKTQNNFSLISDLAVLIDEPLNIENETLLLLAVKEEKHVLVDFLLQQGASVVAESKASCLVEIKPAVQVTTFNTYVVTEPVANQWQIVYRDNLGHENSVNIKNNLILSKVFSANPPADDIQQADLDKAITAALKEYHSSKIKNTPLLAAAKAIGFHDKRNVALFTSLLFAGLHQVKTYGNNLEASECLKSLSSDILIPRITEHFTHYINLRKADALDDSKITALKKYFVNLFNLNRTFERGIELAEFINILIKGESEHDYEYIFGEFEKIDQKTSQTSFSELHIMLREIVAFAKDFVKENAILYTNERQEYRERISRQIMQNDSGSNDAKHELLQKHVESIENKAKQDKMEQEKANRKNQLEIDRLTKENEKIRSESKQCKQLIARLSEKVESLQQEQPLDTSLLLSSRISETGESRPKKTQSQSEPVKMIQPQALSFFNPARVSQPSLQNSLSGMAEDISQLLLENEWQITNNFSGKRSFFSVLAMEISRILNHPLDENDLRGFCATFAVLPAKKLIITKLHQDMKDRKIYYDLNRDNYNFIKFDKNTLVKQNNFSASVIAGLCCIEGVLLCREIGLPAILEITINQENQMQYSMATVDGFLPDIHPAEFEKKALSGGCPVLLNHMGHYYCISKAAAHNPEVMHSPDSPPEYPDSESDNDGLDFELDEYYQTVTSNDFVKNH